MKVNRRLSKGRRGKERVRTTSEDLGGKFVRIDSSLKKQVVYGAFGLEGSGKTSFGMCGPGPLAYFAIDVGHEGVVQKWVDEKDVQLVQFEMPSKIAALAAKGSDKTDYVKKKAREVLDDFHEHYELALNSDYIRTIVIDNSSSLWELVLLAHLGKTVQIKQTSRTMPNLEMDDIVRRPLVRRDVTCNVVHILRASEIYRKDKGTGRMGPKGYNQMGFLVQAMLECTVDKDNNFWVEVVKSTHDPKMKGEKWMVYSPGGDETDLIPGSNPFSHVSSMLIEGTDPDDWE